jgi:hypothetical protein
MHSFNIQYMVHSTQYAEHRIQYTVRSVQYTEYSLWYNIASMLTDVSDAPVCRFVFRSGVEPDGMAYK